jgi:DNA-binding beta-propeller fold protein YncE
MKLWHAVEMSPGSFVVCQRDSDQISEIDEDGCVRHVFGLQEDDPREQFRRMFRVAVDRKSCRAFVVDFNSNRVVVINANAQFERVILNRYNKLVASRSLCYASGEGLLAVAGEHGVFVYAVK